MLAPPPPWESCFSLHRLPQNTLSSTPRHGTGRRGFPVFVQQSVHCADRHRVFLHCHQGSIDDLALPFPPSLRRVRAVLSPRPTTLTKRLRFLRKVHGTLSFGHAFPKFFVFVAESEYLPKALLPWGEGPCPNDLHCLQAGSHNGLS